MIVEPPNIPATDLEVGQTAEYQGDVIMRIVDLPGLTPGSVNVLNFTSNAVTELNSGYIVTQTAYEMKPVGQ